MESGAEIYTQQTFFEAIILLAGAVLAAPLFKRIGLGTVLGYLAVGILISPVLRLINDPEEILHFAELGVVMLLFIIGLELKPARLWSMRTDILGLGAVQVGVCGILLTLIAWIFVPSVGTAVVIGFGLALSSTAFALQTLESSGNMNTPHGRRAFSILLFQDLIIIPFLALLPLFSHSKEGGMEIGTFLQGIGAIAFIILCGRYLLNPFFRLIGRTGAREVMIAAALLIVFGSAALMQVVGLSMALGAFLAGVILAESTYRHELEADIEPFRGLLLGLFFMAIGMSLNLSVVAKYWYLILGLAPLAMAIKAIVIYLSSRLFGGGFIPSIRIAAVLPQNGEFGFVLFAAAVSLGIFSKQTSSVLTAIVILSMALTPLTVMLGEWLIEKLNRAEEIEENFEDASSPVMMIGFSRMGQVAAQSLLASGIDLTIIDNSVDRIRNASKFGFRIYFGDGKRREVLAAAGIQDVKMVAICTHSEDATNQIVDMIKRNWPDKKLYVRTVDRKHHLHILDKGVDFQVRETFESSMLMGAKMLEGLGFSHEEVKRVVADVRRLDEERLKVQQSEGISAGMDMVHTRAVKPEPLVEPQHEGTALDDRSRILVEIDDDD